MITEKDFTLIPQMPGFNCFCLCIVQDGPKKYFKVIECYLGGFAMDSELEEVIAWMILPTAGLFTEKVYHLAQKP